ncbi:MAG: tetratricopeptide repeat protein [Bacteroidia bacterium]
MKMLLRPTSLLAFLLVLASCENTTNKSDLKTENNNSSNGIYKLEQELKNAKGENTALPIAQKLEKELVTYATKHKNDSLAPKYLYKAARLNETYFDNYTEAFAHYNSIAEEYANTRFAPVAMFKRGLIMETVFKKSDKAIYYLDEFMKKHPKHKLVDMAKQIITTSGVDANDLFERIKANTPDSATINN